MFAGAVLWEDGFREPTAPEVIIGKQADKLKRHVKKKLTTIKPVKVHYTGVNVVQLECPYGASEAFRTSAMAMKMKRRHEQKWRHRNRLCRLFKGM